MWFSRLAEHNMILDDPVNSYIELKLV